LQFKRNECFSLFDSAIERLKIDIKYLDKEVKNPLILFRGELVNEGTLDIDKSSIYEPLIITVSENYEWLEINSIESDNNINSSFSKISKSEIEIKWDLLKKGENLEFEALVETKKKDSKNKSTNEYIDFYNSLEFKCRITNLDKVECSDRYESEESISKFKRFIIPEAMSLSLIFLFILLPFTNKYFQTTKDFANIYYEIHDKKGDSIFISQIIPVEENLIFLKGINGKKEKITTETFNAKYGIKKATNVKEALLSKIVKIVGIILSLMIFIHIVARFLPKRKKIDK